MELRASCKQIFCSYTHPLPLGFGQKVKKVLFSESSHVAYQIKGNGAKNIMQANILSLYTLFAPGVGSKGQNIFSESSHVASQIKGNGAKSTTHTHILSSTCTLGWVKRQKHFFLKVVMLHIELKRMKHKAPYKRIVYPYTHPPSLGWGQTVKIFFLIVVMMHIKLEETELSTSCKHLFCPYTHPQLLGPDQMSKLLNVIILHIKTKGKAYRPT